MPLPAIAAGLSILGGAISAGGQIAGGVRTKKLAKMYAEKQMGIDYRHYKYTNKILSLQKDQLRLQAGDVRREQTYATAGVNQAASVSGARTSSGSYGMVRAGIKQQGARQMGELGNLAEQNATRRKMNKASLDQSLLNAKMRILTGNTGLGNSVTGAAGTLLSSVAGGLLGYARSKS